MLLVREKLPCLCPRGILEDDMKKRISRMMAWLFQFVFGLFVGFLVGILLAIKPAGGRGLLRSSDTLPFVLGVGLLFAAMSTQFCKQTRRRLENVGERQSPWERIRQLKLRNIADVDEIVSIMFGMVGVGLMILSFLKALKIVAR